MQICSRLSQQRKRPSRGFQSLLAHPNVRIGDPANVLRKLERIGAAGRNSVCIVTDFNMTLTKYWVDGKQNCDTFNVLEAAGVVSQSLIDKQARLRKEYCRIESNFEMSLNEKAPLLTDIIQRNNSLYVEEGLARDQLSAALCEYPIVFREGVRELVAVTGFYHIPILVFSAGLGDVVIHLMRSQSLFHDHISLISNFMDFQPSPPYQIRGFHPPLVHTLNKGTILAETNFPSRKKNTILIGDSLADLQMAPHQKSTLSIGLLNHHVEENLSEYLAQFDLVITNDASLDWLNRFIRSL